MIKLGNRARDIYTGFSGIVVGRTEWLYGCTRIGIDSTELKEGKPVETQWFDEQRCEVVEDLGPVISAESSASSGGPYDIPKRATDPKR